MDVTRLHLDWSHSPKMSNEPIMCLVLLGGCFERIFFSFRKDFFSVVDCDSRWDLKFCHNVKDPAWFCTKMSQTLRIPYISYLASIMNQPWLQN